MLHRESAYELKFQRRLAAGQRAAVVDKRFPFQATPEVLKAFSILRSEVYDLKKRRREVKEVGVFGSLLKGYAHFFTGDTNADSDLDVVLFYDRPLGEKDQTTKENELAEDIVSALEKNGLKAEVIAFNINKKNLLSLLRKPVDSESLAYLFLPTLGVGTHSSRRLVIEELKKNVYDGPYTWDDILTKLWRFENNGFSHEIMEKRKKFYNVPLEKALQHYTGLDEDVAAAKQK